MLKRVLFPLTLCTIIAVVIVVIPTSTKELAADNIPACNCGNPNLCGQSIFNECCDIADEFYCCNHNPGCYNDCQTICWDGGLGECDWDIGEIFDCILGCGAAEQQECNNPWPQRRPISLPDSWGSGFFTPQTVWGIEQTLTVATNPAAE